MTMKRSCLYVATVCLISTALTGVQAQDSTGTAPSFLEKPLNTTAKLHTTVVLTCKVTGNPPPTITWMRYSNNRETVIRTSGRFVIGAVFRYLYILGVQWMDAGRYACVAQNQHGRITADVHVTVVTDAPPTWQIKPHNVTLYTGQQYTVPCRAYGYPDPVLTWTRNGLIVAEMGVRALLKDLYFSQADPSLTGWYTCTASNLLGTVSQSIYVQVVPDPSIVTQPQDVFTSRGGTFTVSCGVVASIDSLSVNWSKNGNNLLDNKQITITKQAWQNTLWYTLKITKARNRNLGRYRCTVTNLKGSVRSNAAKVSFSGVQVPLTVVVPQPIVITTQESDVELKCVFLGLPIPQVSWYNDEQDVSGSGFQVITAISNRSEAVLKLGNVKQSSAGSYICRGDSVSSTVDGHITLIVRDATIPDLLPLKSKILTVKDSDVSLKCLLGGSASPKDVLWYKESKEVIGGISSVPLPNGTYISTLDIANVQYDDSGLYTCTVRNQFGVSSGNVTLTVKGSPATPTNITVNHTSYTTVLVSWIPGYDGGADVMFIVKVRINTSTAWRSFEVAGNTTEKSFNKAEGWKGSFVFRVTAVNQYGPSQPAEIQVMLDGDDSVKENTPRKHDERIYPVAAIAGGVAGGTVLVVLVIIVAVIILCKRKLKRPAENIPAVAYSTVREDLSSELDGSAQDRCDTYSYVTVRPDATYAMAAGGAYASVPRQKQWEVPKRQVQLDEELGSGHFGRVVKGWLKTKAGIVVVAVKTLKDNAGQLQKKEFLAELELMKSLAPHPNIVGLVGCCSKSEQPYILVEYCALGNLRDFLRASHGSVVYANMAGNSLTLTCRNLLSFAWQVARGMSYLASQKLVHRDLAARNVLVDTGNVCKIADFGLARDIYEKKQYLKTGEAELPLRWMAIESIFKGVTTTKSDVWSFGILLWEVVTLGANPYPAMTREQVISQLPLGYRMPKPPFCTDEIYSIMWECWQEDPECRPTFLEIGKTLHRLMTAEKISIDLSNFDVSYINATEEQ